MILQSGLASTRVNDTHIFTTDLHRERLRMATCPAKGIALDGRFKSAARVTGRVGSSHRSTGSARDRERTINPRQE